MQLELSKYPVKHAIDDNFISLEDVNLCCSEIARDRGKWVSYSNDAEKKTTCNDVETFGPNLRNLLERMQSREFATALAKRFGMKPLQSDPLLHGGGIHISGTGGKLNVHLDYSRHPRLPLLQRKLNCILYLVPFWCDEWGGATVLTKPDGCTVVTRVYPKPGRLFIFQTNDESYHGVEPVTCPEGVERVTLATYYLGVCPERVSRERALFVPDRMVK